MLPEPYKDPTLTVELLPIIGGKGWSRTSYLSGFNRTLYQLSYFTLLESTAGFEPANNRVATCPLRPLGNALIWED